MEGERDDLKQTLGAIAEQQADVSRALASEKAEKERLTAEATQREEEWTNRFTELTGALKTIQDQTQASAEIATRKNEEHEQQLRAQAERLLAVEAEKASALEALTAEQEKVSALSGDRESLLQTVQALQEQLQLVNEVEQKRPIK